MCRTEVEEKSAWYTHCLLINQKLIMRERRDEIIVHRGHIQQVLAIKAILNQPQIAPFDKPVLGTAKFRPVIPRPDRNRRQLTGIQSYSGAYEWDPGKYGCILLRTWVYPRGNGVRCYTVLPSVGLKTSVIVVHRINNAALNGFSLNQFECWPEPKSDYWYIGEFCVLFVLYAYSK